VGKNRKQANRKNNGGKNMKTNEELMNEIRRLRNIICLLEDTRVRDMSMMERPSLFDDVLQVYLDRQQDRNGNLPSFE
jgi:hypothetical protein